MPARWILVKVSVVTPIYNTADYLGECIESVLKQSFVDWEYILVDNQSTDGSGDIARRFAAQDPRIRVLTSPRFLSQTENYNFTLEQISDQSEYCKMVQADDWIFPDCLKRMVEAGDRFPRAEIIGAYQMSGVDILCDGIPHDVDCISGRDACRMYLLQNRHLFGTPNSVMYRAAAVRKSRPFYPVGVKFMDTEACYQVLKDRDFAFVHEILTFTRVENDGITSSILGFNPYCLHRAVMVAKYGKDFLTPKELEIRSRETRKEYFRFLSVRRLATQSPAFWDFHRRGMSEIGWSMESPEFRKQLLWVIVDTIFNPKKGLGVFLRSWRARRAKKRTATPGTDS